MVGEREECVRVVHPDVLRVTHDLLGVSLCSLALDYVFEKRIIKKPFTFSASHKTRVFKRPASYTNVHYG